MRVTGKKWEDTICRQLPLHLKYLRCSRYGYNGGPAHGAVKDEPICQPYRCEGVKGELAFEPGGPRISFRS